MTGSAAEALRTVISTVQEAIDSTGAQGIPSGHLYAMLMQYGCSLNQFQSLIGAMVGAGKITEDGNHVLRGVRQ